jgi:succinoglycan biosynthesis protein ExoM
MLANLLSALVTQLNSHDVEAIVIDNCPNASALDVVAPFAGYVRYVHEAKGGVVHARNRGVAEARGAYIIFLDDDEVPSPGWLSAFVAQADGQIDMAFGKIAPRCLAPCPSEIEGQISRLFSRNMGGATGDDITAHWAYLGTGNAMFRRATCFGAKAPFDVRFNARGGEDIWLINSLVAKGKRLTWNEEALVDELVPPDRLTLTYLKARKFNQGQLRCIFVYGDGGIAGKARVAVWMAVGAVQVMLFGAGAAVMNAIGHPASSDLACRAAGGLGKLRWRQGDTVQHYQAKL